MVKVLAGKMKGIQNVGRDIFARHVFPDGGGPVLPVVCFDGNARFFPFFMGTVVVLMPSGFSVTAQAGMGGAGNADRRAPDPVVG